MLTMLTTKHYLISKRNYSKMAKIKTYKAYKENVSLDKFCEPQKKCPTCQTQLVCQENPENILYICETCDYKENHEK